MQNVRLGRGVILCLSGGPSTLRDTIDNRSVSGKYINRIVITLLSTLNDTDQILLENMDPTLTNFLFGGATFDRALILNLKCNY